jgi:hypothetical protein
MSRSVGETVYIVHRGYDIYGVYSNSQAALKQKGRIVRSLAMDGTLDTRVSITIKVVKDKPRG